MIKPSDLKEEMRIAEDKKQYDEFAKLAEEQIDLHINYAYKNRKPYVQFPIRGDYGCSPKITLDVIKKYKALGWEIDVREYEHEGKDYRYAEIKMPD